MIDPDLSPLILTKKMSRVGSFFFIEMCVLIRIDPYDDCPLPVLLSQIIHFVQ